MATKKKTTELTADQYLVKELTERIKEHKETIKKIENLRKIIFGGEDSVNPQMALATATVAIVHMITPLGLSAKSKPIEGVRKPRRTNTMYDTVVFEQFSLSTIKALKDINIRLEKMIKERKQPKKEVK